MVTSGSLALSHPRMFDVDTATMSPCNDLGDIDTEVMVPYFRSRRVVVSPEERQARYPRASDDSKYWDRQVLRVGVTTAQLPAELSREPRSMTKSPTPLVAVTWRLGNWLRRRSCPFGDERAFIAIMNFDATAQAPVFG